LIFALPSTRTWRTVLTFVALLSATALPAMASPPAAPAGSFLWNQPSSFTAAAPGSNPDHDNYGARPWTYVESPSNPLGRNHNPSGFQHLSQFATGLHGGLVGWRDPTDANALVGVNPSAVPITSGGDKFATGRLVMIPPADRFVAVGWTSPLSTTSVIHVSGSVTSAASPACAVGSSWSLDRGGVSIDSSLISGSTIAASTTVAPGASIYLTVDPGPLAGLLYNEPCAATAVTLTIVATGVAPHVTLDSPANGAVISGRQPTFSGTASQGFGASGQVTIRVYTPTGKPIQAIVANRSGGTFAAGPNAPLPNGTYVAQAEQGDAATPPDLGFSAPVSFTVRNVGPPPPGQLIRTYRVAPPGVDPNGPSGEPSLSANSRYVAFASVASNLGPRVGNARRSNVYVMDFATGIVRLVSAGRGGGPANGSSSMPSISADGQVVAFASTATNLVAGAPKHISDIFVRIGSGPIRMISVAFGGVQPDSDSSQPVVSADGRYVAFTSTADNLIAGDDNGASDVFVADLTTGAITRVSVSSSGTQANRASYNPSIDGAGRLVSFTSDARNLVRGDRNRVADVFVRDRLTGRTRRVSVSTRGREQNASVALPFTQVSDLSTDGHYIVFDSDATNLVGGDSNGHTDVFRHSLLSGNTARVSVNSLFQQSDNDSFAPVTSANGRVTAFESFADNLAAPFAPSENVFAQDLTTSTALTLDVAPNGGPRGPELDPQLLQRPAISADGQVVAFTSGADNLVANDFNGTDDLFVRVISPPATSIVLAPAAQTSNRRPLVEFRGSNALSTTGLCVLDGRRQTCPLGRPFRLRKLNRGSHTLKVFAGAPGTLFDPHGAVMTFTEV
jgi:Tol biopolymer transport system component